MSYEAMRAYLETVVPPVQVEAMVDACQVLHDAGLDGHDFAIEQELALAEDGDSATTVQSLRNVIMPLMQIVFANFGIVMVDETTMLEYTDILRGLLTLENYGDPITIVQMCDNSEGPESALSEILPFVGAYTPGHYTALFVSVNASLLERIEAICLTQVVEEPGNKEALNEVRDRLVEYSRRAPEELMVIKDIRRGAKLNSPLGFYLEDHLPVFEAMAPEKLAVQMLGYVLASDTPQDKIREVCDNEFDAIYTNAQHVTAADVAVLKLLTKE